MSGLLYLGTSKKYGSNIWLEDFKWDCDWYWGGGYLGNKNLHYHLESYFQDAVNAYDSINADFGDSLKLTSSQLWRFCDLFKQFYSYKTAAECAQYGGHYTSADRKDDEINADLGVLINKQIEIVIREIRLLCEQIKLDTDIK